MRCVPWGQLRGGPGRVEAEEPPGRVAPEVREARTPEERGAPNRHAAHRRARLARVLGLLHDLARVGGVTHQLLHEAEAVRMVQLRLALGKVGTHSGELVLNFAVLLLHLSLLFVVMIHDEVIAKQHTHQDEGCGQEDVDSEPNEAD